MCRCFLLITDTLVEVSCVQQLQLHDYLMSMIRSFVSGSSGHVMSVHLLMDRD